MCGSNVMQLQHADDFIILSNNPEKVMKEIETVFKIKDDYKGPPILIIYVMTISAMNKVGGA